MMRPTPALEVLPARPDDLALVEAMMVFWRTVLTGKPGLAVHEHARPPAWIYEFDVSV
jgi:hypothetical protein